MNLPSSPVAAPDAPKRPAWRRWLPLLGLVLLAWIISRLDRSLLMEAVGRLAPTTIALAAASFGLNLLVKAHRWRRLLGAQGLEVPTGVVLAAFFSGQFYGQVTLGRLGEFYRAEALIQRGVPTGQALSSCLYDRVVDVLVVLGLGAVMSAALLGQTQASLVAVAMGTAAVLGLLVVARPQLLPAGLRRVLTAWGQRPRLRRTFAFGTDVLSGVRPLLGPALVLETLLWTGIAWSGYFGALFILSDGMGLSATRTNLTAGAALAALSSLLPVTVSGLGARELIFQQLLEGQGVSGELAVVLALAHLAVMTFTAIGTGLIGLAVRQRQH